MRGAGWHGENLPFPLLHDALLTSVPIHCIYSNTKQASTHLSPCPDILLPAPFPSSTFSSLTSPRTSTKRNQGKRTPNASRNPRCKENRDTNQPGPAAAPPRKRSRLSQTHRNRRSLLAAAGWLAQSPLPLAGRQGARERDEEEIMLTTKYCTYLASSFIYYTVITRLAAQN